MRVTALLIDQYEQDGWTYQQTTVRTPLWADIESSVRALNQFTRPSVRLLLDPRGDDAECMVVMGGQGSYWVAVTVGEHDQRRLFDPLKPSYEVPRSTSDQGFSDHAFHVCDLATALRAAHHFAYHGDCDLALARREDLPQAGMARDLSEGARETSEWPMAEREGAPLQ